MTDSQQLPDIKAALNSAFDLLESANAGLTQTREEWDTRGPQLTKTTLERVRSLNDPPVSPARTEYAAKLENELAQFRQPGIPLVPSVGSLLSASQDYLLAVTTQITQIMRTVLQDSHSGEIADAAAGLKKALDELLDSDSAGNEGIDDALKKAGKVVKPFDDAAEANKALLASAAVATNEVGKTVQEVAALLTARLNLLLEFLSRTDPPSADTGVSRWPFFKIFLKAGIDEGVLQVLEQIVEAGAEVVVKEAAKTLTLGAFAILDIAREVREKRKALQVQREHAEELLKIYRGLGLTDHISILAQNFQHDATRSSELVKLIRGLTERLQSGLA